MKISEEAKISLMLRFNFSNSEEHRPLTPREFSKLLSFLQSANKKLTFLNSHSEFLNKIENKIGLKLARLSSLLNSGYSLSLNLDKWEKCGIWVLCHLDDEYPLNLKLKFKQNNAPILFGVGNKQNLNKPSIGIVGPRNSSSSAEEFTKKISKRCVENLLTVISGGAKGIDICAQESALEHGGLVICVLSNDLEKECLREENMKYLLEQRLILISTELPDASWSVGRAMGRNKYIHSMADAVIVPECSKASGGTWAGVIENLKKNYSKLYFRPSSNDEINNTIFAEGGIHIKEIDIEEIKDIKNNPNYSLLTVKDIASFQGKSIKAVKTFLTKNNMSCKDYPPSKKEKNSSSDDIQIEKQGDLFRDD